MYTIFWTFGLWVLRLESFATCRRRPKVLKKRFVSRFRCFVWLRAKEINQVQNNQRCLSHPCNYLSSLTIKVTRKTRKARLPILLKMLWSVHPRFSYLFRRFLSRFFTIVNRRCNSFCHLRFLPGQNKNLTVPLFNDIQLREHWRPEFPSVLSLQQIQSSNWIVTIFTTLQKKYLFPIKMSSSDIALLFIYAAKTTNGFLGNILCFKIYGNLYSRCWLDDAWCGILSRHELEKRWAVAKHHRRHWETQKNWHLPLVTVTLAKRNVSGEKIWEKGAVHSAVVGEKM